MTTPRPVDGLKKSSSKRRAEARKKITRALREMQRKKMDINPNALARYSGVSRKTIYHHTDLLQRIRAAGSGPRPQEVPASTPDSDSPSSTVAALREQLRIQKRQYETDLAACRAKNKQLQRELAAAHGEIHRLRSTGT